ncbi:addiction module protein [candidate division WOR-3 bacterium]|nr:addiction module protein [candidate division WOR-3 bacterium]
MTARVRELAEQARKLRPIERERLAEDLLAPLADRRLTKVDEAWVAEAERRYRAWKRGRGPERSKRDERIPYRPVRGRSLCCAAAGLQDRSYDRHLRQWDLQRHRRPGAGDQR